MMVILKLKAKPRRSGIQMDSQKVIQMDSLMEIHWEILKQTGFVKEKLTVKPRGLRMLMDFDLVRLRD